VVAETAQAIAVVHGTLGPGLPEHVYRRCLRHELTLRGLRAEADVPLGVSYKGQHIEDAFRATLVVEDALIVDIRAGSSAAPMQEARLRLVLMHSGARAAMMIDFHEPDLQAGLVGIDAARPDARLPLPPALGAA
jgi:GxxExxY protein